MKRHRRSLISLGLAALLPVIVFVAVQVIYQSYQLREQVRTETLGRAKDMMFRVDAEVGNDLTLLRLMSTSSPLRQRDFAEFFARCQRALGAMPHLATIALWDAPTHRQVFDLRAPFGSNAAPMWPFEHIEFHSGQLVVGDIDVQTSRTRPVIYLYYPVFENQQLLYVLSVAADLQTFQNILLSYAPPDTVAAIVDQSGRFIGRTINFSERAGKPATIFVRQAIARGSQGFYQGVTYEGFKNYTAYYKSSFLGWSAHIGVSSSLINGSKSWSLVVAGVAALGAVILAAVLVILVLRDMEERRQAGDSLRQSQKMEAIGQLTGGIAHDFNNLLTVMIGGLDLIVKRTVNDERVHKFAVNSLAAARRGAKLTSQLLAFSRRQAMSLVSIDLQVMMESVSELLLRAVGPNIRLTIDIASQARYVVCDPLQLEFVLLNLASNARDAMPHGGELIIRSAPALKEHVVGLPARDYVQIEVSDNGVGMSDEVRHRAFEPFFTTKPVGEGTGLGLSQVFGVLKQSNGTVHLFSTPGAGTRVLLVLPRGEAPVDAESMPLPNEIERQATSAAVLVVDDDEQVRTVVVEVLNAQGYRTVQAENSEQAFEILAREELDLLLIDYAMPGQDGAETARLALQRYPHLKVLMMSGYADTAAITQTLGNVPFIRKPFDSLRLLQEVAAALRHDGE